MRILRHQERKAIIFIGIGHLLLLSAFALGWLIGRLRWGNRIDAGMIFILLPTFFLLITGIAFVIVGIADYADAKGYSRKIGVIAAFLLLFGLCVLMCFPNVRRRERSLRLPKMIAGKKRLSRIIGKSLEILGGIIIAVSIFTALALPVYALVAAGGMPFWVAVGIVLFLPVIPLFYPLLALAKLYFSPAIIVYGGPIIGGFLIKMGDALSGENKLSGGGENNEEQRTEGITSETGTPRLRC